MFLGYALQPQILRRNGVFLWFVGKQVGKFRLADIERSCPGVLGGNAKDQNLRGEIP